MCFFPPAAGPRHKSGCEYSPSYSCQGGYCSSDSNDVSFIMLRGFVHLAVALGLQNHVRLKMKKTVKAEFSLNFATHTALFLNQLKV